MSLQDYQKQIDDYLQRYEKPYWHPLSQFARMVEEVGEVSRVLNHKYGDKVKKSNELDGELAEELADVLFTVMCLANQEGINLDEAMQKPLGKMRGRDADRYKKKSV